MSVKSFAVLLDVTRRFRLLDAVEAFTQEREDDDNLSDNLPFAEKYTFNMFRKLLGPTGHCTIDYCFVATLFSAPRLLGMQGAARKLCYLFGGAAGILTSLTNQPFAVKRVVPFRVHGQVDTPFVPTLLLLPWATGALKQPTARRFFLSFTSVVLLNYLLTNYEAVD